MAFMRLLVHNFANRNVNFSCRVSSLVTRDFWFSCGSESRLFSTSESPTLQTEGEFSKPRDPKATLSARLSFVFDQIDAIEKDRGNKDEALQRIRSWRDTKKKKEEDQTSKIENADTGEMNTSSETEMGVKKESLFKKEVEVVHPWPEWVEFMERLVRQNYFEHRRRDEDKIVQDLSIDVSSFPEEGYDFSRDWTAVRTACLNFGRDRFDILRSLSRQDIQILVGHGCPSTDKKVVYSGKMLRKHVHLDEGDVCSSCKLRSSCEKAYLVAKKEEEARTIDVIRVLLTYGFDPINGAVENKSLLKLKTVKTVVRKLLHEINKLSSVPIDPNLPPPVIRKPPPKVKTPPPPPRRRVGRDDIEMKKGDWLCSKCDFMNFAKNTVCLQCDAKRPKRQLLPGEWECPECNFLNYRRNMACFHCEHKRPPDEFMENQARVPREQHGPRTKFERVADMPVGSNSWNFDFDDNESDGADVAAFEYADPPRLQEDSPIEGEDLRQFDDDSFETGRISGYNGREKYLKPATGFDDFDDEEDDDINSYEIETPDNNTMREPSRNFADVEGFSGSEDFDTSDLRSYAPRSTDASSRYKSSRSVQRKEFSEFDSDEEPSVSSDWRSKNARDSRNSLGDRGRGRGRGGSYRGSRDSFGSDSESDEDHFRNRGRESRDSRDSDRGRPSRGSQRNTRESQDSSFGRSSQGSFRNNREFNDESFRGGRGNDSRGPRQTSDRGRRGGGRGFNDRSERSHDFVDDRPPRRPRVNVR
ncbi:hypothetical protein ACHQM5_026496 [Ranunculus cassubicifolius]